jgi:hypothetical protein
VYTNEKGGAAASEFRDTRIALGGTVGEVEPRAEALNGTFVFQGQSASCRGSPRQQLVRQNRQASASTAASRLGAKKNACQQQAYHPPRSACWGGGGGGGLLCRHSPLPRKLGGRRRWRALSVRWRRVAVVVGARLPRRGRGVRKAGAAPSACAPQGGRATFEPEKPANHTRHIVQTPHGAPPAPPGPRFQRFGSWRARRLCGAALLAIDPAILKRLSTSIPTRCTNCLAAKRRKCKPLAVLRSMPPVALRDEPRKRTGSGSKPESDPSGEDLRARFGRGTQSPGPRAGPIGFGPESPGPRQGRVRLALDPGVRVQGRVRSGKAFT